MTLQDLMKPLGINSGADLSKKTGLSRQLAHLLWTGQSYPGWKSAQAIQRATGVQLEHLLSLRKNGR